MAAFSYQHPFPHPFFIDSVFPHNTTTATTSTTASASPGSYLKNMPPPTGSFMDEPGSSAINNSPQFNPPELFLQQGVYGAGYDSAAAGLQLQPQNYGFSNECSIDTGDNVVDNRKARDCELLGAVSKSRNNNNEEEEASVVTRKQSTDGHSSTTESGEQVTQFKSTPPTAMDHTKKRKRIIITSNHKKAKKSCDVEVVVEEETKKKKQQQQGKTGREEVKQSKKEEQQQRKKKGGDEPPTGYIHVRARRGQATDSHSLAERARREKISERMKLLQHLVPGCDKVTGKAPMLDEIINYIQSLQNQVEFLSMKLASVNPLFCDFGLDLDGLMVRPESLSSNVMAVASPPELPSSGQQCNPTTTVHQQPHTSNFAADASTAISAAAAAVSSSASISCYMSNTCSTSAIFPGQKLGDFSQSNRDNGGSDHHLLWDMDVEDGRQKLVNHPGFGIGSSTTTNNSFLFFPLT